MREHRSPMPREGLVSASVGVIPAAVPDGLIADGFMARRLAQLRGTAEQRSMGSSGVLRWHVGPADGARGAARVEWARMLNWAREIDGTAFTVLIEDLREFVEGGDCLPRGHGAAVADVNRDVREAARQVAQRRTRQASAGGREEFTLLKSVYQDVFEVAHRNLALIARVANLARRGDARVHVDGLRFSLRQAAGHTTASQRERWLRDYPKASKLYTAIDRATRNAIGHNRVRYDPQRNDLLYDNGTREPYSDFLARFLNLPTLTGYLQDIISSLLCLSCWRRVQQRPEFPDRAEVLELFGVDNRADARDLTVGDIERDHADETPLRVLEQHPGSAVDLYRMPGGTR